MLKHILWLWLKGFKASGALRRTDFEGTSLEVIFCLFFFSSFSNSFCIDCMMCYSFVFKVWALEGTCDLKGGAGGLVVGWHDHLWNKAVTHRDAGVCVLLSMHYYTHVKYTNPSWSGRLKRNLKKYFSSFETGNFSVWLCSSRLSSFLYFSENKKC